MFRGKKLYNFYNKPLAPKEKCISNYITKSDFVVQFCNMSGRCYLKFDSCESFYLWYSDMPQYQKSFFELIREHEQKFRIDIDEKVDDIYALRELITKKFIQVGIDDPKLLIYDIEKSYHMVLTNYSFPTYNHCKYLGFLVSEIYNIDTGVYSSIQHFRIEGCTKYGENRWKKRMANIPTNIENFHEGIISSTKNVQSVTFTIPQLSPVDTISNNRNNGIIPLGFKIRWKDGLLVVLDRVYPSYCIRCKRVHDKENAYMVNGVFYCYRYENK